MGRKLRKVGMFENPEHIFPRGDQFLHVAFESCPCRPQIESSYIRGIGGAAWYQHRPMMVPLPEDGVDFIVPDIIPYELMYPGDNDPED